MESYVILAVMHFTTMQTAPDAPIDVAEPHAAYEYVESQETGKSF